MKLLLDPEQIYPEDKNHEQPSLFESTDLPFCFH